MSKYIKISIIAVLCLIFFAGCSIGKTVETTPQTTTEETYYFDPTDIGEMDMLGGSPEEEFIIGEVEVEVGVYEDEGIVGEEIGDIGGDIGGSEDFGGNQDPQIIVTEPPMETFPDPYE